MVKIWSLTWNIWDVYIWVNYNVLTTTSLEIIVYKGNHPQMALIQVLDVGSFGKDMGLNSG
jgi:hypothetical protein